MNYSALLKAINTATAQLQGRAAMAVNQALVLRNWLVGAWILEFEQHGKDRAKYGKRLLESLAKDLSVSGLELRNLQNCRLLYATYPQIRQTVSAEFKVPLRLPIRGTASPEFMDGTSSGKRAAIAPIRQTLSAELPTPLSPMALSQLSWSHFQELITIDDPWKRAFFENECLQANWSVRQLRRQIGSLLYERTGLSTNKNAVIEMARKQERQQSVADLIRDPYVLEFTGLAERPEYLESDLEKALLATSSPCHRRRNSAPSSKPTANASTASCRRLPPANAPRANPRIDSATCPSSSKISLTSAKSSTRSFVSSTASSETCSPSSSQGTVFPTASPSPGSTPEGEEINLLTVIPNESYQTFVTQYQSELRSHVPTRHSPKGKPPARK